MKHSIEKKLGFIGVGMVGSTLADYYSKRPGLQLKYYDKFKKIGSIEEVNEASIVFICVPTPFNPETGADISAIEEAIDILKGEKIIVIKSTILPGTTDKFQKDYPQHKILHCPEFLKENSAVSDFAYPERNIIGYTEFSKDVAEQILELLPNGHHDLIIKAKTAELAKYFSNIFLASKVIFGNQIFDLCKKLKIDYKKLIEVGTKDSRIGVSHLDVNADGYRGYAGKCFKKDMKAFIRFARDNEVPLHQLEITDKINDQFFEKKEVVEPKVKKTKE